MPPADSPAVPPPVRVEFSKRLKLLRVPVGFPTARSFATALGIDENRYTRYERAEVEPDLSLLMKICALLRVSPNDLLDVGHQTASPGFSESADEATFVHVGQGAPEADAPSSPPGPRQAMAWQLAESVVALSAARPASALDNIKAVVRVYAEIVADPFMFVARLTDDPRLARLDRAAAERISRAIEGLVNAVNAEILRRP
jgi:transcriptional regulator with XRE-family HTH domain